MVFPMTFLFRNILYSLQYISLSVCRQSFNLADFYSLKAMLLCCQFLRITLEVALRCTCGRVNRLCFHHRVTKVTFLSLWISFSFCSKTTFILSFSPSNSANWAFVRLYFSVTSRSDRSSSAISASYLLRTLLHEKRSKFMHSKIYCTCSK